jgi:phage gp36-like protein
MTAPLLTDGELLAMGIASNALAVIPESERDKARAAATGVGVSYWSKRFKPPFTSIGDAEKRALAHIATYDLLSRRGYNPLKGGDPEIKERYDAALQWLRDCARGLAEPEIVDSSTSVPEGAPLVATDEITWKGDPWL